MRSRYGKKTTESLSFRFSFLFALFAAVILIATGIYNYAGKLITLRSDHKEMIQHISEQLRGEIAEGTYTGYGLTEHFERVRLSFGLSYICYTVPDDETGAHYTFLADTRTFGEEDEKASSDMLSDTAGLPGYFPLTETDGIVFGESNGLIYSSDPVFVNNVKTGIIYIGQDIHEHEKIILIRTIIFIAVMGVFITALCVLFAHYTNKHVVSRMRQLSDNIEEYTCTKEPDIAARIRQDEKGNDEIAVLAQQTASMMSEIHTHIDRIMTITGELMFANERADKFSELARKDAMTGLENKLAFYETTDRIDAEIKTGKPMFAVIVIDLNYLKKINDKFGHNRGDTMIKKLADIIKNFFKDFGTYRIGGDEFAVMIEGHRAEKALDLADKFRALIAAGSSEGYWEYPSAAVGCSNYRSGSDMSVKDVFDRADAEMYGNKVQMKANRRN